MSLPVSFWVFPEAREGGVRNVAETILWHGGGLSRRVRRPVERNEGCAAEVCGSDLESDAGDSYPLRNRGPRDMHTVGLN